MNQPALRLTHPGQLPAPGTGDDSLHVLTEAIEHLARLRTPYWLGDSAVRLHSLTSLIAQAEQLHPAPGRPRRPRPGTHLDPDRRAPRHHRRHRGTPLPEQTMINLTRITGIMPMSGSCTPVYFSLSHEPKCVSHRETDRSTSSLHPSLRWSRLCGAAVPRCPPHRISQYETSKPLCDRLIYAIACIANCRQRSSIQRYVVPVRRA